MSGHIEKPEHWVNQIRCSEKFSCETGGFTEFVPLGFVHQNTLLFHQGLARRRPKGSPSILRFMRSPAFYSQDLSTTFWLSGQVESKLSGLFLHAGANDNGGTLMEENIRVRPEQPLGNTPARKISSR